MYGIYDNTIGLKLGSEFSVLCTHSTVTKELTCVYERPTSVVRDDKVMEFSYKADGFSDSVYPLKYGMPRDDMNVPIARSLKYLREFSSWFLQDIPHEVGIMFCVPLMGYQKGLDWLKNEIRQLPWGTVGRQFILEAWAGAVGTIGIDAAMETHTLAINFGSTTTEVLLQSGKQRVHHAVWPYGGANLDVDLSEAIKQAHRGATVTRTVAREIKEQFNLREPQPLPTVLVREGRRVEVEVQPDTIRPVINEYLVGIANWIGAQFLPKAAQTNEKAVTAIQRHGTGIVVACGGMVNMPGFTDNLFDVLWRVCGLNPNVQRAVPQDGVTAPAIGSKIIADEFETERRNQEKATWEDLLE